MQHKAPRNGAQFLQRRVRAGRIRQMRPMTVVTLSDYGRDRLAYQAYESLFDPEVTPRSLPIGNRYVLRSSDLRADRLAREVFPQVDDLRQLLQPREPGTTRSPPRRPSRDAPDRSRVAAVASRLPPTGPAHRTDEAQAVLWEPPRALISGVVPTLLRRIRSGWRSIHPDPGNIPWTFAPDFVPRALFEPLAVPEVELVLPKERDDVDSRMGVAQALREVSPGRVSKRFAVDYGGQRTWISPFAEDGSSVLRLADFVRTGEVLGKWPDTSEDFVVVRPHQIAVEQPPPAVRDHLPEHSCVGLGGCGQDGRTATGRASQDAVVRRAHERCRVHPRATVRDRGASIHDGRHRGTEEWPEYRSRRRVLRRPVREPGRTRLRLDVDGLEIQLALPTDQVLREIPRLREPGWRPWPSKHALLTSSTLRARANVFQLQWLHQAVLAALIDAALDKEVDLAEVLAHLSPTGLGEMVKPWVRDLADSVSEVVGESREGDEAEDEPTAHVARLLALLEDPTFSNPCCCSAGGWLRRGG